MTDPSGIRSKQCRWLRTALTCACLTASATGGACAERQAAPPADAAPSPRDEKATSGVIAPAQITPEGERSIEHGTRWLLSTMRRDGSVSGDIGERPDLSCTAMVGLALVSQGNTPRSGPHSAELSRITDAVLNMADSIPPGETHYRQISLVQRKIGRNADRFLAALFLSQVLGEAGDADQDVRTSLDRLVAEICRAQGVDGTWGNESWAPVLGTVLGWESLRAAHACGLKVDASAKLVGEALRTHLEKSMSESNGWMHDFYKEASSIRVLHSMGYRSEPVFKRCAENTLRFAKNDSRPFQLAGGEEYLAFFLVTECFLQQPEAEWQEWYPTVSKRITEQQNADGSWSGHHCITDRTFCTAAALLTLQSANYCLPISNQ